MAQQINLFNPIFLQKKKHFSAVTMLQALGLLLAGVMAFYGYALLEARGLARVAADSSRQLAAQGVQLAAMTREFSPQGRSRMLEDEVARMSARLRQRQELLALMRTGGLGNTEGFSRYLSALAHETRDGVWLTGVSIAGDESVLQLTGRVLYPDLVPAYIRSLNNEAVMRGRKVSELRLTAREEQPTAATAAPGGGPQAAATPARYVEFSLIALRAPDGSGGHVEPAPRREATK